MWLKLPLSTAANFAAVLMLTYSRDDVFVLLPRGSVTSVKMQVAASVLLQLALRWRTSKSSSSCNTYVT